MKGAQTTTHKGGMDRQISYDAYERERGDGGKGERADVCTERRNRDREGEERGLVARLCAAKRRGKMRLASHGERERKTERRRECERGGTANDSERKQTKRERERASERVLRV